MMDQGIGRVPTTREEHHPPKGTKKERELRCTKGAPLGGRERKKINQTRGCDQGGRRPCDHGHDKGQGEGGVKIFSSSEKAHRGGGEKRK